MAIVFPNGFNVASQEPIDARLVLTKEQMLNTLDARMPEIYFAICLDDSKIYIYNVNNEIDDTTGKFRVLENGNGTIDINDLISTDENNGIEIGEDGKLKVSFKECEIIDLSEVISSSENNILEIDSSGKLYVAKNIDNDIEYITDEQIYALFDDDNLRDIDFDTFLDYSGLRYYTELFKAQLGGGITYKLQSQIVATEIPKEDLIVVVLSNDGNSVKGIYIGDGEKKYEELSLIPIEAEAGALLHSLTIGNQVFDGSEDVTVNNFNGDSECN